MAIPMSGASMPPAAVNDSARFICVRLQSNSASSGGMNTPKPYCPAPVFSAAARNGADATHQPR